ncbi:MAG TPA: heavy metal translocating P-type ATPase metal-binding domain-containing protein [Candidatus Saccharimonadia bacterium]|nr:heavy metal translocating P-type ATPase metal-binding domain-containing protein [Candidatus Saccharimonadia bacterium]
MSACIHCGTPVPTNASDARFCCAGCAYVHELLQSEGLEKFYQLRGAQPLIPVSVQALRERDHAWLAEAAAAAEGKAASTDDGLAKLDLSVQGMSCLGCVWLIEKVHQQQEGSGRVTIHPSRGELTLEWTRSAFSPAEFAVSLQRFGYLLGPKDDTRHASVADSLLKRVGLCGAFAMNAMAFTLPSYLGMAPDFMFAGWFDLVAACSATLALLVGGSYFAEKSWRALQHGVLHIDTPITLGIGAAWLGAMAGWATGMQGLKYFDFVATFVFLMLAGRWLQQSAVERNSRRMLKGAVVAEHVTVCLPDGSSTTKPLRDVQPEDTLRLKQGELCPVRARLQSPSVALSLEWINGESAASERAEGQMVPSGSLIVSSRPVDVIAMEGWEGSLLQRLITSDRAEHETSPFVGALLRWYLVCVVIIGIAGAVIWLVMGAGIATALQVMISVFVVSCPCALGVAAPFADDLAASKLQALGVFVRASFLWQRLVRVRRIMFDKTGTLTAEHPALKNPQVLQTLDATSRHALRHLVSTSLHPVSRSLYDSLGPITTTAATAEDSPNVEEVVGMGLMQHLADGTVYALGRPGWITPANTSAIAADVLFTRDGITLAGFEFQDRLRPATRAAVDALRQSGYQVEMLSGDRREKVALIAEQLGLPANCWHAGMTPDEKAAMVRHEGAAQTLFIGDGANDSLAFDEAMCAGSPVTGKNFLEHKADFYFLGNSLRFVPALLAVAHRRMLAVRCVFAFALLYNASAIALALAGMMSPLLAAVLMPASSMITLVLARAILGGREFHRESQDTEARSQAVRGAPEVVGLA